MNNNDLAELVPQLRAEKDMRRAGEDMRRAEAKDRGEELHDGAAALRDDMKSNLDDLRSSRAVDAAGRAYQRRLETLRLRSEVADNLRRHAEDRRNATMLWSSAFGRQG